MMWSSACLLVLAAAARATVISVLHDAASGNYSVHDGEADGWVVRANFSDQQQTTGWARLEIEGRQSEGQDNDEVMAFAAGLAEAHLTSKMIADFLHNVVDDMCADPSDRTKCTAVNEYFRENLDWMRKKVNTSAGNSPYWRQVGLVLSQMDGLQQGIADMIPEASGDAAVWLNAFPEAMDLKMGLPVNKKLARMESSYGEGPDGSDHCSVLIRLLPDNADLLVGHNTWVHYNFMSRLLKKVTLPFRKESEGTDTVAASSVAFSGFPGSIASLDDFHVTSAGLVTTETSLDNYNKDLWTFLSPRNSVMQWIRATVANRVANSGQEWHNAFKQYNSGTYNNQWMIVDYKKFEAGSEGTQPGLLWVTEQMPGLPVGGDVTQVLAHNRYWASYNQPYFPIIDDISGNKRQRAERGDFFSHNKNPRAQLFRRDHVLATNITTALRLMRHNNFTEDPLSSCNCSTGYTADNAIASRRDLNDPDGTYPLKRFGFQAYGAVDAKVTSSELAKRLEFVAEAGPTHDNQPVFQWSGNPFEETVRHRGQPDRWEFTPIDVTWKW